MNDQTPQRMTVDEYLPWALAQGGRWELIDGRPIKMPSETLGHIDAKAYVWLALKEIVEASGQDLHVLSDGATVRIDERNANEPDCLVYAGPRLPDTTFEVPAPLIVVEVVSPTSSARDRIRKRADYFSRPTIAHYLIVDPETRTLLLFDRENRQGDGHVLGETDAVQLTPPGLTLPVRRCFSFR